MIAQIIAVVQTAESCSPVLQQAPRAWTVAILPCIMLLVGIGFWGLVIFGIVQLIRFLGSARKEQKLIRMELGKLADEVGQIRQELKGGTEQEPLTNSEGDQ